MTEYAETPATEAAKKQYAADKEAAEQAHAEFAARAKWRPTPTQEELDHTMLGAHITMHDDDGSGPEPWNMRALEAAKGGGYTTRQVTAQQHRAPAPPHRGASPSRVE